MRPSELLVRIEVVEPQMRARTWAQKQRMIVERLVGQVLRQTQKQQVKAPMSLRIVAALLAVGRRPVLVPRKRVRRRKRSIQKNIEEPLEQCNLVEEEPEAALPIRRQAQVAVEERVPSKPPESTRKQVPCRTEKETARKKWVRERAREPSNSRIRRKEQKEANHTI